LILSAESTTERREDDLSAGGGTGGGVQEKESRKRGSLSVKCLPILNGRKHIAEQGVPVPMFVQPRADEKPDFSAGMWAEKKRTPREKGSTRKKGIQNSDRQGSMPY